MGGMDLRRKLAAIAAGTAAALVAVIAAGHAYYLGYRPDRDVYPVHGIDVSHHQGNIDWDTLKADGIDFAYIKATEGGDVKDTRFQENWREAGRVGIVRGAYHFFTLCRPGADQARNFIESVPVTTGTLPPAVDLEFVGNCSSRPPTAVLMRELGILLAALEDRFKTKLILYVMRRFDDPYLRGELQAYGYWLRSLFFEPKFNGRD